MSNAVTFEEFRKNWLADVGGSSTTEKGRRFALKLMAQSHLVIDRESPDLYYCDGTRDGGIDLAYLDRGDTLNDDHDDSLGEPIQTWYIVQSKFGKAFKSAPTLIREAQKIFDTLQGKRERLNSLSEEVVEKVRLFMDKNSDNNRLVLVFATEDELDDKERQTLNDIGTVGRDRFGARFDIKSLSVADVYETILEQSRTKVFRVPIDIPKDACGGSLWVGTISLKAMYDFLSEYRRQTWNLDKLYEKNVRRFLGNRIRVNKEIQETLRHNPDGFGLYNNGVTFVVSEIESVPDPDSDEVVFVDPYIVNGCQTTMSIWSVFDERLNGGGNGSSPEVEAWQKRVNNGVVVIKVVRVKPNDSETLRNITRFANKQTAVREKDFISLNNEFRKWKEEIAERFDVFLETQRGEWDAQNTLQRRNPYLKPRYDSHQHADATRLIKVYAAGWLNEVGEAWNSNSPFLPPDGKIFKRIVDIAANGVPFGASDLYAAFLIDRIAEQNYFGKRASYQRVEGRGPTRFLFYRIIVELTRRLLVAADLQSSNTDVSKAIIKLCADQNQQALRYLTDTSVTIIDAYMDKSSSNSVHSEPIFQDECNGNINTYLKWSKVARSENDSPKLFRLLELRYEILRDKEAGKSSKRDAIIEALQTG